MRWFGRGRAFRSALLLSVVFVSMIGGPAWAGSDPSREYEVKAAFLYNFQKFVKWNAAASDESDRPLAIGIIGEDPFGGALDKVLEGKEQNGRAIVSRRLSSMLDIEGCNILFVCSSEVDQVSKILKHLDGQPILTVGETNGFVESGGAIEFIVKDDRVRIKVNTETTAELGLEVSPRLLKIAEIYPLPGGDNGRADSSP